MAQQPPAGWCGTREMSPWFRQYRDQWDLTAGSRGLDTNWLYVPMTIHLVGNDEGAGYFPINQAMRALCDVNAQYAPSYIRFYLYPGQPFAYHDNSAWYEHDFSGGSDMINQNRLPNRVNNFVVADPAGNCGYSWQDAVVMGRNCSGDNNTVWAHELGHHLSLPHPFFGWEGFDWDYAEPAPSQIDGYAVERKNGTNCNFSGDRICDTPPDYLNYRWPCNSNGESNVVQHDPNNVPFQSDATLFMGYAVDACAARFSPEQTEAMRENLLTEHADYLQIADPLPGITPGSQVLLISPVDTQLVQYNDLNLTFVAPGNARIFHIEIGLFPNFTPTIFSKSVIAPPTGNITVHVNKQLPNNRVLYWRVLSYNEWDVCGQTTNLQSGIFKTQNLSGTTWIDRNLQCDLLPNPVAAGSLTRLLINANERLEARISLTDMGGRTCFQLPLNLTTGEQLFDIPTENLPSGTYFLQVHSEKGVINRRLVVAQ